jgi:uncharacterized protein DUF6941
MAPRLETIIICDDIRPELGNKLTLVGVYGKQIFLGGDVKFPAALPKLCVFLRWSGVKGGGDKISFSVEYDGKEMGKSPAPTALEVPRFGDDYSQTSIQMVPFPLTGFGDYTLKVFLNDHETDSAILKISPPQPK